jgi:hypothetical protein
MYVFLIAANSTKYQIIIICVHIEVVLEHMTGALSVLQVCVVDWLSTGGFKNVPVT